MRKTILLALSVCLVACAVMAAEYYRGVNNKASGTSDYVVPFDGSEALINTASKVTITAPDAEISVSFWSHDGDTTWTKIIPTIGIDAGDTNIPIGAGEILHQDFPVNGRYPSHVYIDRTSATSVRTYWR